MDRHHSRGGGGRLTALVAALSLGFAVGAHAETGHAVVNHLYACIRHQWFQPTRDES